MHLRPSGRSQKAVMNGSRRGASWRWVGARAGARWRGARPRGASAGRKWMAHVCDTLANAMLHHRGGPATTWRIMHRAPVDWAGSKWTQMNWGAKSGHSIAQGGGAAAAGRRCGAKNKSQAAPRSPTGGPLSAWRQGNSIWAAPNPQAN